jgi:hypothetical protein
MINRGNIKKHRKRIIISIILVSLVVTLSIFLNLLLYRSDIFLVRISPATSSISRVLAAEKTGDTVELKAEDINGIIEFNLKSKKTFGPLTITGIYSELKDGRITLFVPARYGILNLFLTAKGAITYEKGNILFSPVGFYIGKLSLPKGFIMDELKHYVKGINISNGKIVINKSILPFDIASITFRKDNMVVYVNKQVDTPKQAAASNTSPSTSGNTTSKTPAQVTHDLLVKANNQLNGVRASAASDAEKNIVSSMQLVIGKMINDASYAYQAEAATVQGSYNKLPGGDRSDLNNAILDNMDMSTLKKLKSTFGF